MSRRAHKAHTSHERWLVSYADFITLLFAFFVVLYASSKADQKKQAQVAQSINSAFQSLAFFPDSSRKRDPSRLSSTNADQAPTNFVMNEQVLAPGQVREDLRRVQKRIEKMLSGQIAQGSVSIQMGKDGLVISLREAGFFASGSATPHPDTLPHLRELGIALGQTAYQLRIEGHTDNVPIHTQEFDSNWELSAARATRLARIFLAAGTIAPDRVAAAGYAEFHPVAPNTTDAGRAENRRVDIVVMPRTTTNLAMPDGDAGKQGWQRISD